MSCVLYPAFKMFLTAFSISQASLSFANEYLHIIAADKIVAIGLTVFLPFKSGAEPCIGSNIAGFLSERLALGSIPNEPGNIEASSDKISPNILPVTITSNCFGFLINCIAALSTYM